MTLVQQLGNLTGVPSYHFHPTFAQAVQEALATFKPTAIALEVSEPWADEFKWGVSCWPSPMVSFANHVFAPMVPGDSMVEAYRLGRETGVPVFFIDLALADPIQRDAGGILPDPTFASRIGNLFIETVDAVESAYASPAQGDLAREAHMAARLQDLMEKYERVLWVGGMAHWPRLCSRLEQKNFVGPKLALQGAPENALRMRLESSSLHRITERLPYQVAQFAQRPFRYSDSACLTKLSLAAVKPEKFEANEVASMLVYARNLAAMTGLRETPGLWELLTSSSSVLGNEYASRLATLALRDRFTKSMNEFPLLTYGIEQDAQGKPSGVFQCDGNILDGEPLWGRSEAGLTYRLLPSRIDIKRRRENNPAAGVKAAKEGEKKFWFAYPEDMKSYEAFVRNALERVSRVDRDEVTPVPLLSGMAEGLDIRATVRHWHMEDIYVREPVRSLVPVSNGLIDWTSRDENSWILQNDPARAAGIVAYADAKNGGWIDPDLLGVGSASRTVRGNVELQRDPFWMQRDHREVSLITLDAPTWIKASGGGRKSFFDLVILPLLDLKKTPEHDNIYGWLEVMFRFCRNKPFAYYSHYKPSSRIEGIGQKFGVRIIHVPLTRIPERMVNQHQSFKFMYMTPSQWEELLERIGESNRAWTASVIERHPSAAP